MPVYLLSSYLMSTRLGLGHMDQVFHCFTYLGKYKCSKMVFDDTYPNFGETSFFKYSLWKNYYPEAQKPIPVNTPKARGNKVITSCFIDADHARCKANRKSHTGIFIFVKRSPIVFSSKKILLDF